MKNFEFHHPRDLKTAGNILTTNAQQSLPYAGGTDVLGLMKEDIIKPEKLVNLKAIPGLDKIEYSSSKGLKIGVLATIAEIADHPLVTEKYAILHQSANSVASPQLRNVGTLGGNLCQRPRCVYFRGDFKCLRKGGEMCYAVDGNNKYNCVIGGGPCFIVHPSDMAVALLALDARITVFAKGKSRVVPIRDFYVLPEKDILNETILKPGEIITEIQIPAMKENVKSGYLKFSERDVWDFAMVSVGIVAQKEGNRIKSAQVAFGGVAPIPWQDKNMNQSLTGLSADPDLISKITKKCLKEAEPLAMNAYKVLLARNLLKQLLAQLMS